MSKKVCGVGINDADYCVQGKGKVKCPYYIKWSSMLVRCYGKITSAWYEDCWICEEWLIFSNFRAWMETQDWEGKHLDKDLLVTGNKVYSPATCVFVDMSVNSFVTDCAASRGDCPIGTHWRKSSGRFRAYCNNPFNGKRMNLGTFDDMYLAHKAWQAKKHEYACQLAELQEDPRVADALRQRYAPDKDWTKA